MGYIFLRTFFDSVCEDVTWISGNSGVDGAHSVWEKLKLLDRKAAAENVITEAQTRVAELQRKDPLNRSLTYEIWKPYLDIILKFRKVFLLFNKESYACKSRSVHAHWEPAIKTMEAVIEHCSHEDEKEVTQELWTAHCEFRRRLEILKKTMTDEQKAEVKLAVPEFICTMHKPPFDIDAYRY